MNDERDEQRQREARAWFQALVAAKLAQRRARVASALTGEELLHRKQRAERLQPLIRAELDRRLAAARTPRAVLAPALHGLN